MLFLLVRFISSIGRVMATDSVFTTKMSSKGQIVIPEGIRDSLGLTPGTQFVVVGKGDTVILKSINQPNMDEFKELLADARSAAKKHKLQKKDLKEALEKSRKK